MCMYTHLIYISIILSALVWLVAKVDTQVLSSAWRLGRILGTSVRKKVNRCIYEEVVKPS